MTIDIAYCPAEAAKTVLLVMPGGTMPTTQPDHVHDDGSSHPVTVIQEAVGDFDPEAYADAATYISTICEPLVPAPAGVVLDAEHIYVDCQVDGVRCYLEPANGAVAVCPINGAHTLNAGTRRRSQRHTKTGEMDTETGKVRCHIDWDDEIHTKSFHEVKA